MGTFKRYFALELVVFLRGQSSSEKFERLCLFSVCESVCVYINPKEK